MKEYDIIYADPPWPQKKGGLRKARPNQTRWLDYPVLSLDDIQSILNRIKGKMLFLWTIDKFLFNAEAIAKNCGYKLHARIIWDKENGIAPAFTIRFCHEYLLWCYKSPMLPVVKEMRGKLRSVLREPAKKHSVKPVRAYEYIESLYPNTSKAELFARNYRNGWDVWGNEVESTASITSALSGCQKTGTAYA